MSGGYDDEAIESERLDADIEQANLQAEGQRLARLEKHGICSHGWRQGVPSSGHYPSRKQIDESRSRGAFPDRPTNYDPPPPGFQLCLDCGQHVKDWRCK